MTNPMVNYQTLAREDITKGMSEHNVMDEFKGMTLEERKAICDADRLPFAVAVLNVTGELNVGTILRSSLLMGASKVFIIGRRRYDRRSTVGSEFYLNVEKHEAMETDVDIDCNEVLRIFEENNLIPIYVEQGGQTIPNFYWQGVIEDINSSGKMPVLVLGNENRGVPSELLNNENHFCVSLPQKGIIRSYNVSVAASMVMMDMINNMGWW